MTEVIISKRLTIRIGRGTLSFAMLNPASEERPVIFEPYVVRSGISMAANLREAFKKAQLLMDPPPRVRVMLDSQVLVMPIEQFDEQHIVSMYNYSFPQHSQDAVLYNVLPDLNAVAVFAINKDLRLVINDHFRDVQIVCANSPVWRNLYHRSFTGTRHKLYGYFHERQLEVFSFQQNRFKFCNTFEAAHSHDALYFLLYVWKQLQLKPEYDEMHLVGDIPDREWLLSELKKYLQKAYIINPSADFNRSPVTEIKGMPYDLMTLFVKGR